MSKKEKCGFIGLGNMGANMARNLLEKYSHKYDILVNDIREESAKMLVANGASFVDIKEIVNCEFVITMLPMAKHVNDVLQIFYENKENDKAITFIDCSTIDIESAKKFYETSLKYNINFIDAPVSGGVKAAADGNLTFMVGCKEDLFPFVKNILQNMGVNIFHAGDNGCGQVCKIANNMLLAIHMIGTSEAYALAKKHGLDFDKFYEISSKSSGQNWSMTKYSPAPISQIESPAKNDYKPGFTVAMMLKDLKLASVAANSCDANTPLGKHALDIYNELADNGLNEKDFSVIFKHLFEK